MKVIPLYTKPGVSFTPNSDGATLTDMVRIVAEDGMMISDGTTTTACIDVPKDSAGAWHDAPYADPSEEDPDAEIREKAEAYDILMGGA